MATTKVAISKNLTSPANKIAPSKNTGALDLAVAKNTVGSTLGITKNPVAAAGIAKFHKNI